MNIPDLVDVLMSYSKKRKPFKIDITNKNNLILSLVITDSPLLIKLKSVNIESFSNHKKSVKKAKLNINSNFPLNQTMNISKLKKLLKW